MFRKPKKRSNAAAASLLRNKKNEKSDEIDETGEEDTPLALLQQKRRQQQNGTTSRSTAASNRTLVTTSTSSSTTCKEALNGEEGRRSKKLARKRRRQEQSLATNHDLDVSAMDPSQDEALYDPESLAQLQQEQDVYVPPSLEEPEPTEDSKQDHSVVVLSGEQALEQAEKHLESTTPKDEVAVQGEESFIALDGKSSTSELREHRKLSALNVDDDEETFDQARNRIQQQSTAGDHPSTVFGDATIFPGSTTINEDNGDDWEEQVARKAGLRSGISSDSARGNHIPPLRPNASRQALHTQLESAIAALNDSNDIAHTKQRHLESQRDQLQAELTKHEQLLSQTGRTVDWLQDWRIRLVQWVESIRNIPITELQTTCDQLWKDVSNITFHRSLDWQDDTAYRLLKKDPNSVQVIGRQSSLALEDDVPTVDEFGRSVQSQASMKRDQRARVRKQIRSEEADDGQPFNRDDLQCLTTRQERDDWSDRHRALVQARKVAVQDLVSFVANRKGQDQIDMDGVIQSLIDDFAAWKREYPEDYKDSYAALTLAELLATLVYVDSFLPWVNPFSTPDAQLQYHWSSAILVAFDEGILNNEALDRFFEKAFLLFVERTMLSKDNPLLLSSRSLAVSMFKLLESVQGLLLKSPKSISLVQQLVKDGLLYHLDQQAIVIILDKKLPCDSLDREYCFFDQILRIVNVMYHVLEQWTSIAQLPIPAAVYQSSASFFIDSIVQPLLPRIDSVQLLKRMLDVWYRWLPPGYQQPETTRQLVAAAHEYDIDISDYVTEAAKR